MSGPVITTWIRVTRMVFVGVLLVSLAGGFCSVVTAIVWEGFRDPDATMRLLMLPFVGLLYGCLGLAALYAARTGKAAWMITGIVLLALGAAGWVAVLFDVAPTDEGKRWLLGLTGSVSIAAVMLTLSARLLVMPQPTLFLRVAMWTHVAAMLIVGTGCVTLIWTRPWWRPYEQFVVAGIVAGVLVVILGLTILPTLARRAAKPVGSARESVPTRMKLELTCPNCGVEQHLGPGVTACSACRFALVIEIEEPRCTCGYLLYRLAGETCPECGRVIPAGERWGAVTSSKRRQ